MPDAPDRIADAKDRLRLTAAVALRTVARLDGASRAVASGLWRRTALPTRSDARALRASITDLTRAVRDLGRT